MFLAAALATLLPLTFPALEDPAKPPAELRVIADCGRAIDRIAADDKGALLCVATDAGELRAWDLAQAKFVHTLAPPGAKEQLVDEATHMRRARELEFGGKHLFVARGIAGVESFELPSWKQAPGYLAASFDPATPVVGLECDPRDKWAWLALADGVLMRYVPGAGSGVYSRRKLENVKLGALACDWDASLLAAGCADGSIRFVNTSSASVDDDKKLEPSKAAITALEFAAKGTILVVAAADKSLRTWNVGPGKMRHTLAENASVVRRLFVDAKGKLVAAGDDAGSVNVWSLETGKLRATFTRPGAGPVGGLALVAKGKTLAVADGGTNVVLWDMPAP